MVLGDSERVPGRVGESLVCGGSAGADVWMYQEVQGRMWMYHEEWGRHWFAEELQGRIRMYQE